MSTTFWQAFWFYLLPPFNTKDLLDTSRKAEVKQPFIFSG